MTLVVDNVRRREKRTESAGIIPGIPPTNDHTDGSWGTHDIYKGELFINLADKKIYTRSTTQIIDFFQFWGDQKVDKVSGYGLSENDFTDALLDKLNNIDANANAYVLPPATTSDLGGVIVGSNMSVDPDGTIHADPNYYLNNLAFDIGTGTLTASVVGTPVVQVSIDGRYSQIGHTHAAADIVSGTFADARISESSVTQHESALTITESQISDLQNYALVGHSHDVFRTITADTGTVSASGLTDQVAIVGGTNVTTSIVGNTLTINSVDTQLTQEQVEDYVGGMFVGNTTSFITSSYDDINGKIGLSLDDLPASKITSGTFADARISQSSVTQHQSALTITESQISDLGDYLLKSGGTMSGAITFGTAGLIQDYGLGFELSTLSGKEMELKSARDVRIYIDSNNDDIDNRFEILSNINTYNVANIVAYVDQTGNAEFSGVVTATGGNSTEWNEAYNETVTAANFSSGAVVLTLRDTSTLSTGVLQIDWSNILSTPTTISGYGITDAVGNSTSLTVNGTAGRVTVSGGTQDLSANRTWTVDLATAGTPGTYTKVTTDAYGRVTSGTTLSATDIPALDASKITTGVFDPSLIPSIALPEFVVVADQTARYALTTATVQNGDVVKQNDTGVLYYVVDDTNLNNASGWEAFAAGTAASVDWTGVQNKPSPVINLTGAVTGTITLTELGAGPWNMATTVNHTHSVNDLSDTNIVSLATNQLLRYDGTNWANWTPNFLTAEVDTLQTVMNRGASSTTTMTLSNTDALKLTSASASVYFDDQVAPDGKGFKRITSNDGTGNWNFRAGSYSNAGDKYTTTGSGATMIRHDFENSGGVIYLRATAAGTADGAITWTGNVVVNENGLNVSSGNVYVASTQVLSNSRVLQNVSGNISMFTNDTGYLVSGATINETLNPVGVSSNRMLRTDASGNIEDALKATNVTNADTAITDFGFFNWGATAPTTGSTGWLYATVLQVKDVAQKVQLAFGGTTSGKLAVRRADNGVFYGWTTFWNDTDFTASQISNWDTAFSWGDWSAGVDKAFVDALLIDSDTLDGQHGAYYLAAGNITGTISDATHGSRGGGTLHSTVTTSVAGFMSAADKTKLDGIATGANAYVHPTQSAINYTNTGADIVSSITVNTLGHVTAVTSRVLTPADIGASAIGHVHDAADITSGALTLARGGTGASLIAPTADRILFYDQSAATTNWMTIGAGLTVSATTISHADTSTFGMTALTGANVIDDINVDTYGHVTGVTTRAITPADIGASASGHTHTTSDITNLASYTGFDTRYYTETEIDNFFSGSTPAIGYNKTNWDTAFGWGDHSVAGYALDANVVHITGTETILGPKTFSATTTFDQRAIFNQEVDIDLNDGIYFETRNHQISFNDGSGNFNIRVGHTTESGFETVTEDGYVFHDEWSQSSGWRQFNVSDASLLIGNTPTWRTQIQYDPVDVRLYYQGSQKFATTLSGVNIIGSMNSDAAIVSNDTNGNVQVQIANPNAGASALTSLYLNANGNNFYLENWGDGTANANETRFSSTAGSSFFTFYTSNALALTLQSSGNAVHAGTITTNGGKIIGSNSNADVTLDNVVGSQLRYENQHVRINTNDIRFTTDNVLRGIIGISQAVWYQTQEIENTYPIYTLTDTDNNAEVSWRNSGGVTQWLVDTSARSYNWYYSSTSASTQWAKLDQTGLSAWTMLEVQSAMTGTAGSHANHPVLRIRQTADTSYNVGDIHGSLEFWSDDASSDPVAAYPGPNAYIRAVTTRSGTIGNPDAGLVFGTSTVNDPTYGDLARDVMILTHEGRLGIGITTPTTPLDVVGTINTSAHGNSGLWSAAYTYSQVGHLPLSGGTVTGAVEFQDVLTLNRGSSINGWNYAGLYYTTSHTINTLNTVRSNSNLSFGYAVKHNDNASGYVSTANNVSWKRSALEVGERISFKTAGSSATSVAVGSPVTLNEVLLVDLSGNLTLSGTLTASGYNKSNWDTAFSWGDHAGLYAAASHTHDASDIISGTFADARISSSSVQQHINKAYIDGLNVDADTLDGVDSTAFLRSDINQTYSASSWQVSADTADGSDNKRMLIAGGGSSAVSRGAYIGVHGNEYSTLPGHVLINAGDIGKIRINGTITLTVLPTNAPSEATALMFDGTDIVSRELGTAAFVNSTTFANASHTHAASDVVSGTFADARISASSVQQHVTKTYIDGLNVDADTLDNINSTQFIRSDTADTMNADLTFDFTNFNTKTKKGATYTGGWARGYFFKDDAFANYGGIGSYGTDGNHNYFYFGVGATPWVGEGLRLYDNGDIHLIGTPASGSEATAILQEGTGRLVTRELGSLAFSSATYDNYEGWNLNANTGLPGSVQSGADVEILGGDSISTVISGIAITINHDAGPWGGMTALTGANVISDIEVNGTGHITSVATRALTAGDIGAATAGHTHSLDDLTDVSLGTPATANVLRYNGTAWNAVLLAWNDIASKPSNIVYGGTGITANRVAYYSGLNGSDYEINTLNYVVSSGNMFANNNPIQFSSSGDANWYMQRIASSTGVTTLTNAFSSTGLWVQVFNSTSQGFGIYNSSGNAIFQIDGANGDAYFRGDVTANQTSDIRLKKNIQQIKSPIDKLAKLRGVEFEWKEESKKTGHDVGVIAQEVEEVIPEAVSERADGFKTVNYDKIIPLLIETTNAQQKLIEELQRKLAEKE